MNKTVKDSLGFHWSNLVPYLAIGVLIYMLIDSKNKEAQLEIESQQLAKTAGEIYLDVIKLKKEVRNVQRDKWKDGKNIIDG